MNRVTRRKNAGICQDQRMYIDTYVHQELPQFNTDLFDHPNSDGIQLIYCWVET